MEGLSSALSSGNDIKLSQDVTITQPLNVEKNCVIDLNGNDISATSEIPFKVKDNVTLTFKNGTVNSTTDAVKVEGKNVVIDIEADAKIVSGNACCIWVNDDENQDNITINVAGTLESSSTNYAAVYVNGNINNGKKVTMNITGGSITSENSCAVFFAADGDLNISGGNITGYESAVEYRGTGTLEISGGTFTTTYDTNFNGAANGSGTTLKGVAVGVSPYDGRESNLIVSGGNFIVNESYTNNQYSIWVGKFGTGEFTVTSASGYTKNGLINGL